MKTDKVPTTSASVESENLQKIRSIFPNFVKDGEVDFDSLQAFLKKDGILVEGEKYGLNWSGKSNAFRALRTSATGTLTPQPEESKNWDTTENIFIEGDNLEVLKLLQKHYREKIKMIYIDPPYNTGKDFVYKDNFTQGVADYYEQTGQTQGGIKMSTNTEKNGRYHSDWLTMMYPRLFLARNLLKEDGVIFVSIDDNEVANLRLMMDEIFGEENFVGTLIWSKKRKGSFLSDDMISLTEYVLIYAKHRPVKLYGGSPDATESQPIIKRTNSRKILNFKSGIVSTKLNDGIYKSGNYGEGSNVMVLLNDIEVRNGVILTDFSLEGPYVWNQEMLDSEIAKEGSKIVINTLNFQPRVFRVYDNDDAKGLASLFIGKDFSATNEDGYEEIIELFGKENIFDYPKPSNYIKYLIKASTNFDKEALVLDFFAGSGTTAHAVMDLNNEDEGNRRWICVQLPETTNEDREAYKAGYKTIAEISRERICRAGQKIGKGDIGFKSYKLAASNYRQWREITTEEDTETLLKESKLFTEKPLVNNFREQNVVYEILLKEGFDLNAKIEEKVTGDIDWWLVIDTDLQKQMCITFYPNLTQTKLSELMGHISRETIIVCLDTALDDTTKLNVARNINIKTI